MDGRKEHEPASELKNGEARLNFQHPLHVSAKHAIFA
jgi:hypothetical protein